MAGKGEIGRWVLVMMVWMIPLGFLLSGYWPIGLFPAILVTLWASLTSRHVPRD